MKWLPKSTKIISLNELQWAHMLTDPSQPLELPDALPTTNPPIEFTLLHILSIHMKLRDQSDNRAITKALKLAQASTNEFPPSPWLQVKTIWNTYKQQQSSHPYKYTPKAVQVPTPYIEPLNDFASLMRAAGIPALPPNHPTTTSTSNTKRTYTDTLTNTPTRTADSTPGSYRTPPVKQARLSSAERPPAPNPQRCFRGDSCI